MPHRDRRQVVCVATALGAGLVGGLGENEGTAVSGPVVVHVGVGTVEPDASRWSRFGFEGVRVGTTDADAATTVGELGPASARVRAPSASTGWIRADVPQG